MDNERYTEELLRFLDGSLPREREQVLREKLERSEELKAELKQLESMRALMVSTVQVSAQKALRPFFTDRTMRRLEPVPASVSIEDELASMLLRLFRPIAVASLGLALFLAAYNITVSNDYASETTTAEAILALPPVTSLSIYDLDVYSIDSVALP